MKQEIASALAFAQRPSSGPIFVVTPFPLKESELAALRSCPNIDWIHAPNLPIGGAKTRSKERHPQATPIWPSTLYGREILFAGSPALIPSAGLLRAILRGHQHVTCWNGSRYSQISSFSLLLTDLQHRVLRRVRRFPASHPIVRAIGFLHRQNSLRNVWKRLAQPLPKGDDEEIYRDILATSYGTNLSVIRKRIVHVNAGLAAGGTERQIVATLTGLLRAGFEDVVFLGQQIFEVPGLDFHAVELRDAGVSVTQVTRIIDAPLNTQLNISAEQKAILARMPRQLAEDVIDLVSEFQTRKPEIVHAWQDATCIAAGLAAVIAGVPRILLSCRNVNPSHFEHYQPYMLPAWRVLAALPQVTIIANSMAGARSYSEWLDIPLNRISIVRNGLDTDRFVRPNDEILKEFRRELSIPEPAPIVCGVFRFWPEKQPALWIETAKEILKSEPKAHFVLVGDGPLKPAAVRLARQIKILDRVHFLGELQDVITPIAASDVLLLTSKYEGLPNILLEAQALRTLVVTTDAGGAREAVENGVTGHVVFNSTTEALAKAVLQILSERPKDKFKMKATTERFLLTYQIEKMIEATTALYN